MHKFWSTFFLLGFYSWRTIGIESEVSSPPTTQCYICQPRNFSNSSGNYSLSMLTLSAGVFLLSKAGTLYDLEKVFPAIEMAAEKANEKILSTVNVKLNLRKETYGTTCTADSVSGRAAVLFERRDLAALIGPSCSLALDHAARLTGYLNVTTVTGGGEDGMFMDKTHFPTLVRFGYGYGYILLAIIALMQNYQWRNVSLFYDQADLYSKSMGTAFENALRQKMIAGIPLNATLASAHIMDSTTNMLDLETMLAEANDKSRSKHFKMYCSLALGVFVFT